MVEHLGMAPSAADFSWLRQSFVVAQRSREDGDQPFGALLVSSDGELLGEATNSRIAQRDPLAHAEMNLVRSAVRRHWNLLPGSTLYSSTEPCMMCAGAIAWTHIGRIVFGLSQVKLNSIPAGKPPRFARATDLRELLQGLAPPVRVLGPILEDEALAIHHGYWG